LPDSITLTDDTSDNFNKYKAMDKNKNFPDCAKDCTAIKMLGVGECENVCVEKFRTSERQLTIPAVVKQSKLLPCAHVEKMQQGDGFTYVVCALCGDDL
jgi:hypothetical protein